VNPNSPQFSRLTGDTPAAETKMSAGFSSLDKLLQDKKPMTAAKKKSMDTAHKKITDARGGRY
jgi:hypothetical protein